MGKVSEVEISGHRYRYQYDEALGKTLYLGPVGDSPPISESEFEMALPSEESLFRVDGFSFHREAIEIEDIKPAYWRPTISTAKEIWPDDWKKKEKYGISPRSESLWTKWDTDSYYFLVDEMGYAESTAYRMSKLLWEDLGPRQQTKISGKMYELDLIDSKMPVITVERRPFVEYGLAEGYSVVLHVGDQAYRLQKDSEHVKQRTVWEDFERPRMFQRKFYEAWFKKNRSS